MGEGEVRSGEGGKTKEARVMGEGQGTPGSNEGVVRRGKQESD